MKIVLFSHSLLSDWNHGNAHFLRGIATELVTRGHEVSAFEPVDAWSVENLVEESGAFRLNEIRSYYPLLDIERYDLPSLDLDRATSEADLVIVHEWNAPELIAALGRKRARGARYRLLFHDTHHRSVSDRAAISRLDLSGYDGVLAFGEAVRERYLERGWTRRCWTWHEAADLRIAHPLPEIEPERDLIWIGNWGDDERNKELCDLFLEPASALCLSATAYGVRYPPEGLAALARAGVDYGGWLPNYRVAEALARHRATIHIPRRPYVDALRGIPTIRVFETLACGVPLVIAHFEDVEGLFGRDDFSSVGDGDGARKALLRLLSEPDAAQEMAKRGRETILARHTCAHRAAELMAICDAIGVNGAGLEGTRPFLQHSEMRAWD